MNKLLIASIAVFFFSCENVPDNIVFPTEPQAGIPGPLAKNDGNKGKGHGGIIGYCVTIENNIDWTGDYPMLVSPEGVPGKARWPNLTLGWYPTHNNPYDPPYFDWIIETSGGPTVAVIPWASITTKKGTVTRLELTLRDFDDPDGLWVSYYGNVNGPFPTLNTTELSTPEDGLTIHVHQNMQLKKALPKVKGDKTPDPDFGWISIGDIIFDTPCPEWPQ